jgi:hypothetical protein
MCCHEWRVLPLTSFLPEKTGEAVFLWAHVPAVVLLPWIVRLGAQSWAAAALSGFAVLHIGLHWLFRNHPAYEFNSRTSHLLILLPGLAGAAHLALVA